MTAILPASDLFWITALTSLLIGGLLGVGRWKNGSEKGPE